MSVVLVTGAAKRLGREIALTFARAGWDVALHCHRSVQEAHALAEALRSLGRRTHVLSADLADEAACRALLPQAVAALGAVQVVVNNASLFGDDDVHHFSYAELNRHMCANVAPAVVLAQALHDELADVALGDAKPGAVVNLLDQKLWNYNPDHLSYTLSKAALLAATEMLARALAPRVRVVGVAPGLTLPSDTMSEKQFERLHQLSPLGRSSTAPEVAQAVYFAATNRALTGTMLVADGGQHLWPQTRDFSLMV